MSAPATIYYCTRCDYRQDNTHLRRFSRYALDSGETIRVNWQVCWCEDCTGIASVEKLSLEKAEEEHRDAMDRLDRLPPRPQRLWRPLHWWLLSRSGRRRG